jgi:hypothetical protein
MEAADIDTILQDSFGHGINDKTCGPKGADKCIVILGQKLSFGIGEYSCQLILTFWTLFQDLGVNSSLGW